MKVRLESERWKNIRVELGGVGETCLRNNMSFRVLKTPELGMKHPSRRKNNSSHTELCAIIFKIFMFSQ